MECLVESHLGGYYVTTGDPKKIEAVCEQCFDYDKIVASWIKGDKKAEVSSISNYLCGAPLDEEVYEDYLEYNELNNIMDVKECVQDMFLDFTIIVNGLKDSGYIDMEVADGICDVLKEKKQEWAYYINNNGFQKKLTR